MPAANPGDSVVTTGHTLEIVRVLHAPRDLVFDAWMDPEHRRHWWGPMGFTLPLVTIDPVPGGTWRSHMRSPEGRDYWLGGEFREIARPERIVFTFTWDDTPDHEMVVTLTFAEHTQGTELTLRQAVFLSEDERDSHRVGWSQSLDRLAAHLSTS
jgi:uncharacterized protein YndB with AHSA1/START domain